MVTLEHTLQSSGELFANPDLITTWTKTNQP
jgi:hypothetical protein